MMSPMSQYGMCAIATLQVDGGGSPVNNHTATGSTGRSAVAATQLDAHLKPIHLSGVAVVPGSSAESTPAALSSVTISACVNGRCRPVAAYRLRIHSAAKAASTDAGCGSSSQSNPGGTGSRGVVARDKGQAKISDQISARVSRFRRWQHVRRTAHA